LACVKASKFSIVAAQKHTFWTHVVLLPRYCHVLVYSWLSIFQTIDGRTIDLLLGTRGPYNRFYMKYNPKLFRLILFYFF